MNAEQLATLKYIITMRGGLTYEIPVIIIALNRAEIYKHEFHDSIELSLERDTLPLFDDHSEIEDWARNNMDWDEVESNAVLIHGDVAGQSLQDGWMSPESVRVS